MVNMSLSVQCFLVLVAAKMITGSIHIDKIEMCDNKADYAATLDIKLKDDGDKQIIETASLDAKVDLNDDVKNKVSLYRLNDKEWNLMITKTEDLCKMLMLVGTHITGNKHHCTFSKGHHEIKNIPIDFSKLPINDIPPGTIKIKSEIVDKDNKVLFCNEIHAKITA